MMKTTLLTLSLAGLAVLPAHAHYGDGAPHDHVADWRVVFSAALIVGVALGLKRLSRTIASNRRRALR